MQIRPAVLAMVNLCGRGNCQMVYRYVHLLLVARNYTRLKRGLIWYLPLRPIIFICIAAIPIRVLSGTESALSCSMKLLTVSSNPTGDALTGRTCTIHSALLYMISLF